MSGNGNSGGGNFTLLVRVVFEQMYYELLCNR